MRPRPNGVGKVTPTDDIERDFRDDVITDRRKRRLMLKSSRINVQDNDDEPLIHFYPTGRI